MEPALHRGRPVRGARAQKRANALPAERVAVARAAWESSVDDWLMGEMVRFPANRHTTSGYLATPTSGKGPGLLVIQEWWGLVDHIKRLADRFAQAGFVALAPDFFDGKTATSPDDAAKLFMALNIDRAGTDLRGAADYLLSRDDVLSKRVGVVGFCMGGQLALYAAAEYPDRIAAAVDFYGIHPKVKVDPAKLRVPVQAHFGKRDESVKETDAKDLAQRIQAAGGSMEAHLYDAGHAFFNDTRAEAYHRASAELAWTGTVEFLRKQVA